MKKVPIRFLSMWCDHEKVLDVVKKDGQCLGNGTRMYQLLKKLPHAKKVLKELHRHIANLSPKLR